MIGVSTTHRPPKHMTVKEATTTLKTLGFTLRYVEGDYRVCPKGESEDVAYYTDDLNDAVWTAKNWNGGLNDKAHTSI